MSEKFEVVSYCYYYLIKDIFCWCHVNKTQYFNDKKLSITWGQIVFAFQDIV